MIEPVPAAEARLTSRQVRVLGILLVVFGTALALGVAWLIAILAPTLMQPGTQIGKQTFTGTPKQARYILTLLGGLVASGAAFAGVGIHQWVTGRRTQWLITMSVALVVATLVFGGLMTVLFDDE